MTSNTKPPTPHDIEPFSQLDRAANDFIAAARHYVDMIKRHARAHSFGVTWLRHGRELLVYTGNARYSHQIVNMTFDPFKDQLHFAEAPKTDESDERIARAHQTLIAAEFPHAFIGEGI